MPVREITAPHRRLLKELTGQISNRLDTVFADLPGGDGPNIGVELQERGRKVDLDTSAGEAFRARIKARRDRMLFRADSAALKLSHP